MALYKYLREYSKKINDSTKQIWRERLIKWRREPSTIRIEHPTKLDRARSLGYKAKKGFIVVRQRVPGGGHRRYGLGGRRSKASRHNLVLNKSYKQIAEERANNKYVNCEVLNSYEVAKDGKHYWFEVILIDRDSPSILADKNIAWISNVRGRVYRGLTSAGKSTRGLLHKGIGAEGLRPSKQAVVKRKYKRMLYP